MEIRAVIFDLDGVIVSTDEFHYQGWKRLAAEEGIDFDRTVNERLRGVSRMESLAVVLERAARAYSDPERQKMAERKNHYYQELITTLTPDDLLPGVDGLLTALRSRGIKLAVASSSKNCPVILKQVGLTDFFDIVVDGNQISHSKPDPEVFLKAAAGLGLSPEFCLVVEDAEAGVTAALNAHMRVMGVGSAAGDTRATHRRKDLAGISAEEILAIH